MGRIYKSIKVETNKGTHEVPIYNLPMAVVEYLQDFYEHGWTPENDEQWGKVYDIIQLIFPAEKIKEITGETFFTDIIYRSE